MREFELKSNKDLWPLSIACFDQVNTPKAVIQISHGMCEYKERYLKFIEYLNYCGYVVVIHDHRGHGKSIITLNDLGYLGNKGDVFICDDLYQVNQWIQGEFPNLPIIMLGHSMGSLIAKCYLKKYGHTILGLILCGIPSNNGLVTVLKTWTYGFGMIKSEHYRSISLQKIMFSYLNLKIKHKTNPYQWICLDNAIVDQYSKDPLCNFTFTLNGLNKLFSIMEVAYSKKGWKISHQIPILLMVGKEDPCLISLYHFNKGINHLRKIGYQNISFHIYEHMYHEILNEIHKEVVYQDIITWINKILE